jgi:hypothetical protein
MHNNRDWREQLHLGRERPASGPSPAFLRLEGPNLWPPDLDFRRTISSYMDATAALGETVLKRLSEALHLDDTPFAGMDGDGYLVMKLIAYHPQTSSTVSRAGVAPHVDFSWLTLTLQDSPGLEVRAPTGGWTLIEPRQGSLWVHAGELLQFATGGRYQAVSHRVINHSIERTRISIPLFMNPPLDAHVPVFVRPPSRSAVHPEVSPEHVHRVLRPSVPGDPFHFGEAEWRRKGLGRWCADCVPELRRPFPTTRPSTTLPPRRNRAAGSRHAARCPTGGPAASRHAASSRATPAHCRARAARSALTGAAGASAQPAVPPVGPAVPAEPSVPASRRKASNHFRRSCRPKLSRMNRLTRLASLPLRGHGLPPARPAIRRGHIHNLKGDSHARSGVVRSQGRPLRRSPRP